MPIPRARRPGGAGQEAILGTLKASGATQGPGAVSEDLKAPPEPRWAQTLIIDGFPSPVVARVLSPNGRAHWREQQACKKIVEANVSAWVRLQKIRPMAGRVILHPTFVFPVHRRRDDDNLATGVMKAVRDTLVSLGILVDDSTEHVRQEPVRVVVEKGGRRLEIVMEEV